MIATARTNGYYHFELTILERSTFQRIQSEINVLSARMDKAAELSVEELGDLCGKHCAAKRAMEKLVITVAENHNIHPSRVVSVDNDYWYYR